MRHIGAGNNQCIQALLLDFCEILIVVGNMLRRFFTTWQGVKSKGVDMELGNQVAACDKAVELALCCRQCGVRHHVQQPDMQFADILIPGAFTGEDFKSLVFEAFKCG